MAAPVRMVTLARCTGCGKMASSPSAKVHACYSYDAQVRGGRYGVKDVRLDHCEPTELVDFAEVEGSARHA